MLYNIFNFFLFSFFSLTYSLSPPSQCTSIGVGYLAMADGSAVATHNDDCNECDIRVTHVPARDWIEGNKRPIFITRPPYPRYLESVDNNIHGSEYLIGTEDSSIYPWTEMKPVFFIPQVAHTYAYTLGNYALQNEKQLSMGESTCAGRFFTTSAYVPAPNTGKARVDVNTLMEVAMERCSTARCAIQTMGDLATTYGFYGNDPGNEGAGEAVMIADSVSETWVFHVSSDDTGESAVWIAQRVPDDHITVVPNQFIIREVNLDDHDNYMASANIYDVAIRNNLWKPESGSPFNYLNIYGWDIGSEGYLLTRRTWRVFTLASPNIQLNPLTDSFGSFGYGPDGKNPYPFSVKPEKKLTLTDIMKMTRDTFEGTPFDLSVGLAAGPFGDVMRYEAMPSTIDPTNGIIYPNESSVGLIHERPISLYRTVYASIAQARKSLPDSIGAVVWIAPYAPHHSSYVPVYAIADQTPSGISKGTQYKLTKSTNYWVHSIVGNYLSRWYKYTIEDVRHLQQTLQEDIQKKQFETEEKALNLFLSSSDSLNDVKLLLTDFHEKTTSHVREQWWDFFWVMVGKYRDQMIVTNPHAPTYPAAIKWIMYPRWWLESIGYWGAPFTPPPGRTSSPVVPNSYPTLPTQAAYDAAYPNGLGAPYQNYCFQQPSSFSFLTILFYTGLFVVGGITTLILQKLFPSSDRKGYDPIPDNEIRSGRV